MFFENVNRNYEHARENFSLEIPEDFNFGFDVIDRWANENDKVAILAVSEDGTERREIRYSELKDNSAQVAHLLRSLGLNRGDHACVVIGRVPQWYDVMIGAIKAGVVAMPGTNLLTAKDLAYRINHASARAAIVTPEHVDKVEAIRAECPTLEVLIVVADEAEHEGWTALAPAAAAQPKALARDTYGPYTATDPMLGYFTSGTTSLPKLVPRDASYAYAHVATGLFWMNLSQDDVHWTLSDTGWAKAAWGMLFPSLTLGCTTVLYNGGGGFDTELHLKLLGELGVTTFCGPPTVYRLFAQQPLENYDFSTLRHSISAGEPLNPEVIRIWKEATGNMVHDGYGQTETINIVANFPDVPVRSGSMGKPVPGFDVNVIDDDGNVVDDDVIGHIAVRTEGGWPPGLFHGYYTQGGELNTKAFQNGWYYTGDTATRDADGYLWFVGRSDDLISSAGYRISPFEVESALLEHPAVMESAVIGQEDEMRGQVVRAFIILAAGYEPSDELAKEIQDFCRELTAPYKYPRIVTFCEQLPKTVSGKIRRVELRADADADK